VKDRFDIVVVGGGLTGLAIAAQLARGSRTGAQRITVVDTADRPRYSADKDVELRVSAISTGSAAILDDVGAWGHVLATRACPYDHMRVWHEADEPDGPWSLHFDADEFGTPELGFIVENNLVRDALLRVLDRSDVSLRFATPIDGVEYVGERYQLALAEGREIPADLVIAADGARSFVRESVGIRVDERPYDQTAFVTHLVPEYPHDNTARQRFLANGPLGMLPLADGRISVVWSTSPAEAEQALQASDADLGALLSDISGHVLGPLSVAGLRAAFPLCARHARRYVLPRLALVGDAAHAVHPLAGQGANLGLQDTLTLFEVLEAALARGEHPGDRPLLSRYERARKGANAVMLHFMTGLNSLFGARSPTVGEFRRAGMRLFNISGPVRERAVRVALGAGHR
jgi:2-octaprenylphenol hydroxylase